MEVSCSPLGRLLVLTLLMRLSRVVPSMISRGSITLPRDLDILFPYESQTRGCRRTSLKGILPVSQTDIITMRATQKKRISWPVSRSWLGKKVLKSRCSVSGHFRGEKGKRPELNQVSSTSPSCSTSIYSLGSPNNFSAFSWASSYERAATQLSVDVVASGLSPLR